MKKGLWLSQRHVRWLIVLLAVLPLFPTALLLQVMRQSALGDRDAAASELSQMYREQLVQLSERFSLAHEQTAPGALAEYLTQVFGDEVVIRAFSSPDEAGVDQLDSGAMVHVVSRGGYEGWTVAIDSVPRFLPHFSEERSEAFWHALLICLGVILVGGVVWFAVHRQLRVDELRGDLLATFSHEIKTPIAASQVLLDTLESGHLSSSEAAQYLAMVGRENERLAELADQFLTFSRLERGQVRLVPVSCHLASLLEEQVGLIQPKFDEVGGTIRWTCDPSIRVETDPQAAKVVLANLLTNVLKYGGRPPRGEVVVTSAGGVARIRVKDWGEGIGRKERSAVFRKYYRSDAALHETKSGMGLGLTICRQFARLVRGGIRLVEAESPGACFEFRLPLAEGGSR